MLYVIRNNSNQQQSQQVSSAGYLMVCARDRYMVCERGDRQHWDARMTSSVRCCCVRPSSLTRCRDSSCAALGVLQLVPDVARYRSTYSIKKSKNAVGLAKWAGWCDFWAAWRGLTFVSGRESRTQKSPRLACDTDITMATVIQPL